jgi:hypothetical protein
VFQLREPRQLLEVLDTTATEIEPFETSQGGKRTDITEAWDFQFEPGQLLQLRNRVNPVEGDCDARDSQRPECAKSG